MEEPSPLSVTPKGILALAIVLWVIGLVFGLYAVWILVTYPQDAWLGLLSLLVAGVSAASGWGLYRKRRWGVILFGGLALAGSINHLASVILRFPDLSHAGALTAVESIISVLGGFLIPFALIYLTLALWRWLK